MTALIPIQNNLALLAQAAILSLESPASRRNYTRELTRWLETGWPLDRTSVQAYMIHLRESGAGASTRNVALASIRLLAREANIRGLIDDATMMALERIEGAKPVGSRAGNWLQLPEVRALIDYAGTMEHGVRNQALLACMAGCGMRRAEVCALKWSQWQQREGRPVWVDVMGKGSKIRSIACPRWAEGYIEAWKGQTNGSEAVSVRIKGITREVARPFVFPISAQSVYLIVRDCAAKIGIDVLSPHDLRRTLAKLSRAGGAPIEQIQQMLGHASVQTTERYLGGTLELKEGLAAADYMKWSG
jgi:integrase